MAVSQTRTTSSPKKKYLPMRLTLQAIKLLDLLSQKEGLARTVIVELAIRELAESKSVKI
jgi:hypothetical protein